MLTTLDKSFFWGAYKNYISRFGVRNTMSTIEQCEKCKTTAKNVLRFWTKIAWWLIFSLFRFPSDSFWHAQQQNHSLPFPKWIAPRSWVMRTVTLSLSHSLFVYLCLSLEGSMACHCLWNGDVWAAEMFGDSKHHKTWQRARKRSFYHERFVSNKRQPSAGLKSGFLLLVAASYARTPAYRYSDANTKISVLTDERGVLRCIRNGWIAEKKSFGPSRKSLTSHYSR